MNKARVWDSSARSFLQRGNSLYILLRSSLLPVEKPCPLSRPRASSPPPFAFAKKNCARVAAEGFLRDTPLAFAKTRRVRIALQRVCRQQPLALGNWRRKI
jgi:hypothetical protein